MNRISRFRRRIGLISIMAFAALTMALPAWATPPAYETAANDAVADAAASALDILVAGIPVVLGVAVAWVGLNFGRKLISKLG